MGKCLSRPQPINTELGALHEEREAHERARLSDATETATLPVQRTADAQVSQAALRLLDLVLHPRYGPRVFGFLDLHSICTARRACKALHSVPLDESCLGRVCELSFPSDPSQLQQILGELVCQRPSWPPFSRRFALFATLRAPGLNDHHLYMFEAAKNGHADAVDALLGNLAPDIKDTYGRTPLHHAAQNGHTTCMASLLAANADVKSETDAASDHRQMVRVVRWMPLHLAVVKGHAACVDSLLAANAPVDIPSDRGRSPPLYLAARDGHTACLTSLLAANAAVDIRFSGCTPLILAAKKGDTACVETLLAANADFDIRDPGPWGSLSEAEEYPGYTALFWATKNGHTAAVQ